MENKVRVEYLFPNIDNERKYKWLANAQFSSVIPQDHEICRFSYEEYLDKYVYPANYVNGKGQNITEEVNKKSYIDWCNHSNIHIYELSYNNVKWDNSMTYQLALYLKKIR